MAQPGLDHAHAHATTGGGHHHPTGVRGQSCCAGRHDGEPAAAAAVVDPVCGMRVDPQTTAHRFAYHGQDYFFCSSRCRARFEAGPDKFLKPARPEPTGSAGALYTCPMHPEVRKVGPGSCPICGMALEPEQVSLDDAPDPELIDMTRRFWIALALTVPVFALEMGGDLGLHLVPPEWSNWISLL